MFGEKVYASWEVSMLLQQKFCLWERPWHSYPSDVISAVWIPSVLAVLEHLSHIALCFSGCPLFLDHFLRPPKWAVYLIKAYVTGKDNTESLKSTYTSFSNDYRLLSFLETSWFLDADSVSCVGDHGWKGAWEPWVLPIANLQLWSVFQVEVPESMAHVSPVSTSWCPRFTHISVYPKLLVIITFKD